MWGLVDSAALERIVVVSPHFDDAVLGAAFDPGRKRAAIECYESQLGPLRRDHFLEERLRANVPEQYWRLAPPPPGWERLADSS